MEMEYKTPPEDLVKLSGLKRLSMFKWWFWILLILGVLALVYIFVIEVPSQFQQESEPLGELAQTNTYFFSSFIQTQGHDSTDMKPYVMVGIFAVLAVVLVVSVGVQLFGKDPDKVKGAGDIVKTCIGFFIGVATSYIGK